MDHRSCVGAGKTKSKERKQYLRQIKSYLYPGHSSGSFGKLVTALAAKITEKHLKQPENHFTTVDKIHHLEFGPDSYRD